MATYIDDFNRVDESPLNSPWITDGGINLTGNQANRVSGSGFARLDQNFEKDQYAEVTLTFATASGNAGPAVRMNELNGCYYVYHFLQFDDPRVIRRTNNGIETTLLSLNNIGFVSGDTLGLGVVGNVLTLYHNGVQIGQATDPDNLHTAGHAGFFSNDSNTFIDSFSANETSATDTFLPLITLTGYPWVNVAQNENYTDEGATANDNLDGDLTGSIVTVNPVDTAVVGAYVITYNVTDASDNNAVEKTRTVNVVDTAKTFIDDFNRIDESPISSPWATANADGIRILNGLAVAVTNNQEAISYIAEGTFADDQSASAVMVSSTLFGETGLAVRCDANGNGYALGHVANQDRQRLYKFVNGVRTTLEDVGGYRVRTGTLMTLEVVGNVLNTYADGVLFRSYTDTVDPILSGNPGIYIKRSGSDGSLANFSATGLIPAIAITSVNTDNTVTDGQQDVPVVVSGFAGDVTSMSLRVGADTLALTGLTGTGDNYTIDLPDISAFVTDTVGLPFSSPAYQVELLATNGTDTAAIDITLEPKAGYTIVETVSATTVKGSLFEGRVGGAPFDGGQMLLPAGVSATQSGIITSSIPFFVAPFWDVTSGMWEIITFDATDETSPVITLLGNATVTITEGSTYVDAGATALDAETGDLTANIVTVNPVNTAVPGTYTVTYNVSDAAGNPAVQVSRTVIVEAVVVGTPAPTVSINAIGTLTEGDTGTATATTTNTTSVAWSATGAVSINASTGAYTVNSAGAWSITATATGAGGSASDTISGTATELVITSTATVTIEGITDGAHSVKLYDDGTDEVLHNGNLTFSNDVATVTVTAPVGTVFTGNWKGTNPPETGTGIYGVTA